MSNSNNNSRKPPLPFKPPLNPSPTPTPTPAVLFTGRMTGSPLNPQREAIPMPTIQPEDAILGVVIVVAKGGGPNPLPGTVPTHTGISAWIRGGLDQTSFLEHTARLIQQTIEIKAAKTQGKEPS